MWLLSLASIAWMAEECTRIRGDVLDSLSPNKQMFIVQQPVGVVGAVTPWNFPANMIMRKVAPALAAGCPVSISLRWFSESESESEVKSARVVEAICTICFCLSTNYKQYRNWLHNSRTTLHNCMSGIFSDFLYFTNTELKLNQL